MILETKIIVFCSGRSNFLALLFSLFIGDKYISFSIAGMIANLVMSVF